MCLLRVGGGGSAHGRPVSQSEAYFHATAARGRSSAMASALGSAADLDRSLSNRGLQGVSDRADRLLLVIDALWSIVRESGLDDDALRRRVAELEAAGRPVPARCRACDSALDPARASCAFCGEPT